VQCWTIASCPVSASRLFGGSGASIAMDAPFFHELRRQASSYLTGKIRSARLALTDVTPTQL
jgi:hypothetical protein